MELVIALLAGAVGGNLAASVHNKHGFGLLGNTVLGAIGGGGLYYLLALVFPSFLLGVENSVSLGTLLLVLILGVGGGVVLTILCAKFLK